LITRDPKSAETKITYTDADKKQHVVWFEDMESVAAKEAYLKTRGISKVSFWAYSYF
jgi:spore germination protein YaaH